VSEPAVAPPAPREEAVPVALSVDRMVGGL
jgi:hypothetical protein